MFGGKKEKRFAVLRSESVDMIVSCKIVVDKVTGVNYLLGSYGNGGGLTPLLDAKGQVIVSSRSEIDELLYK